MEDLKQTPAPLAAQARRPNLDSLFSVNPDGSRNTIHPATVGGRFQRRKNVLWAVLIAVYLVLPWLDVGGNPAILIDIGRRHFFLFGWIFTAQDFWLAFFFVTGVGFSLFVVSALFGRLWCGYACPQTVFLEGVYRRIEAWIEGSPRRRKELDRAPWTGSKIGKRLIKYVLYGAASLALSHTVLSYFMPVEEVFAAMTSAPSRNPTAFTFVVAFTAILFVNFTWFREQLCIVICPYGRLQGVLYDSHTVNVGYDHRRGEPRGKLSAAGAGGDCVDCYRCVAVCPTGIDIRNGTQLECIGCANCIDACDEVMDKVGRERGLVRYDTLAVFEGRARRFWRPRVALYGGALVLGLTVFALAAGGRAPFQAELLRLPRSTFTLEGGVVSNAFSLRVQNKESSAVAFHVEAAVPAWAEVVLPVRSLRLESLQEQRLPLFVRGPRSAFRLGDTVQITVRTDDTERVLTAPILGPRGPVQPPSKGGEQR
ncbi:MAG: cytochrome c oxidase accessory protein CcoG [Planctomycetota bacterium]